jgi:hypothetical protein
MLGRLRMSLEECEDAYLQLSEQIFTPTRQRSNFFGHAKDFLKADGRFDAKALENAIKECVRRKMPEDSLLKDPEDNPSCRVSVLAQFLNCIININTYICLLQMCHCGAAEQHSPSHITIIYESSDERAATQRMQDLGSLPSYVSGYNFLRSNYHRKIWADIS